MSFLAAKVSPYDKKAAKKRIGSGRLAAAVALGYLVGTFPSADVASRVATGGKTDLRAAGSGNPGGANAMKVLGTGWGLAVIVADVAKGALASRLAGAVAGDVGAHVGGTASVVGHCFPVWTGFRGGKGVAASAGQCLATFPAYFPIDLGVAALTGISPWWKHRAFSATALASGCWVAGGVVWWRRGWPNAWGPAPSGALPAGAAASSAVIMYKFLAARKAAA